MNPTFTTTWADTADEFALVNALAPVLESTDAGSANFFGATLRGDPRSIVAGLAAQEAATAAAPPEVVAAVDGATPNAPTPPVTLAGQVSNLLKELEGLPAEVRAAVLSAVK